MSEFEFVQITFAIILGLGVTSLLASIADQLKIRNSKPLFPLQLFAQSVLLLLIFMQLWGFWAARDIEWNILLFLLHALSPICYAIAAYSSGVELDGASSLIDEQYFSNHRVVYGFWALASLFGIGLTFYYMKILNASVSEALPLVILRVTDFALLLSLTISKRRFVHWFSLGSLLVISGLILFLFFLELE